MPSKFLLDNIPTKYILEKFSPEDATFLDDPCDIVHEFGDMVSALLYSTIFFPDFIEVDDSILLRDNLIDADGSFCRKKMESFRSGKIETNTTVAELEASHNSIEVAYLFSNDPITLDDPHSSFVTEMKLATIIADAWRDKLKRHYPSRVFSVSVLSAEESGSVISVEFFEIR
jgi:hypothetical protein